jgi:prophage regulatory protein
MIIRFLRYPDLRRKKGIPFTRMHLRRLIKAGKFPRPIKLGDKDLSWIESEIDDFIAGRIAARDAPILVSDALNPHPPGIDGALR